MQEEYDPDDRPATPDSSSLCHVTGTIDDRTHALIDLSKVPSPEPQSRLALKPGRKQAYSRCKESERWDNLLVVNVHLGSTSLQWHEYSRAKLHHGKLKKTPYMETLAESRPKLSNHAVAEASNKTALQELKNEAHSALTRLTLHHARTNGTMGLDTRLTDVIPGHEDIRQERDSQAQRAKLAGAGLAALKHLA
ncbi:hypothetical protein BU15DRAFT_67482, partial [Melanogaster broomeanus]